MQWYVTAGEHAEGPFDAGQECDLSPTGLLQLDDNDFPVGGSEWPPVRELAIIAKLLPPEVEGTSTSGGVVAEITQRPRLRSPMPRQPRPRQTSKLRPSISRPAWM